MTKEKSRVKIIIVIVLVAAIAAAIYLVLTHQPVSVENKTVEVWHSFPAGSAQEEFFEKKVLAEYGKTLSSTTPVAVYVPEDEMFDRLLAARNEGTTPVAVFLTQADASELLKYDKIEDTVPVFASAQVMLYNPVLFEKAGISPASRLDEFWAACDFISNAEEGVSGCALPGYSLESLAPFVWSGGGQLVSEEGTKTYGYLNSPENVAFFVQLGNAVDSGVITIAGSKKDAIIEFISGKTAMLVAGAGELAMLAQNAPEFQFETIQFPSGRGGSITVLDSKVVVIPGGTDSADAKAFLEILLKPETLKTLAPDGMYPVAGADTDGSDGSSMAEAIKTARTLPATESAHDMSNEFALAIKQMVEGYKTPQEALDDLALTWQAYL